MNWLENLDLASVLLIILAVVAIKSTLLAVIVWFGIRITRTRSSTARHQAAVFVLLGMLLMPALVFFVPATPLPKVAAITEIEKEIVSTFDANQGLQSEPVLQRSISPQPKTAALQNSAVLKDSNAIDNTSLETASPAQPADGSHAMATNSESSISPIKFFLVVYLIGVATLLGNLLMGWLQCNRITSNATQGSIAIVVAQSAHGCCFKSHCRAGDDWNFETNDRAAVGLGNLERKRSQDGDCSRVQSHPAPRYAHEFRGGVQLCGLLVPSSFVDFEIAVGESGRACL